MIDYELIGHVAVITINRPEARNAVNGVVANGIEAAIDQLEADDNAWVGILTGARTEKGYIFCAGHWDYDLDNRGVLFSPAYFPPDVRDLHFCYRVLTN